MRILNKTSYRSAPVVEKPAKLTPVAENQNRLSELEKNQQFDRLILMSATGKISPLAFKELALRIEAGETVVM